MNKKVCRICGVLKLQSEFGYTELNGYNNFCKYCNNKVRKKQGSTDYGKLKYVWYKMHDRCYNKQHLAYVDYGGRGIGICVDWYNMETFIDWALSHGWKPGLQIDRIDNDGDYCPENCRFVTCTQNNRNTRATKLTMEKARKIRKRAPYEYHNVLAKEFGVTRQTISEIARHKTWKEK